MGHSQFYCGQGSGHFHTPGRSPGICFESAMDEFSGKDEAFLQQWLVRQGLEKLVDIFKGMFSQFWIFLHLLEIFNVKDKI